MAQEYYNLAKAAEVLSVSPAEVNQMREQGKLHGYRDGADWKFKKGDVDAILAEQIRSRPKDDDSLLLTDEDFDTDDAETGATMLGGMGSLADLAGIGDAEGSAAAPDLAPSDDLMADDLTPSDDLVLADDQPESATELAGATPPAGGSDDSDIFNLASEESSTVQHAPGEAVDQGSVDPAGLDDDDVVLGGSGSGSGSDLNLGGDSGVSLIDPADSGLSLDDPIEILGGADEVLELGEDDMLALTGEDMTIDTDTATELKPDDDFLLTPDADDADDASESSSQVIALDSDADFGDLMGDAGGEPELVPDEGMEVSLDLDAEADAGAGLSLEPAGAEAPAAAAGLEFTPAGPAAQTAPMAQPGVPGAAAAPTAEAPYSGLLIAGLGGCIASLALCGFVTVDLIRNMWSWDQPFALNSSLMDMILGLFGG